SPYNVNVISHPSQIIAVRSRRSNAIQLTRYGDRGVADVHQGLQRPAIHKPLPLRSRCVVDALSCNQLGWSCARSMNDAVPVAPEYAGASETYLLGGSPIGLLPSRTA